MSLPILAVAFAIYIFGIAIILFFRPKMMFKPGGSWKEFGIGRGETHTILPIWLFAVFWAFISYGVALVVLSQFANVANSSSPGQQSMPQYTSQYPQPQISYNPANQASQGMFSQITGSPGPAPSAALAPAPAPAPLAAPVSSSIKPVSSMIGLNQNLPGYYVLAKHTQTGQPQYIYYGNNPPSVANY